MKGKIILEEAWNLPKLAHEAVGFASPKAAVKLADDMVNIQGRIEDMDRNGIEMQILSFTSPGCQGINDPKEAAELARESNDYIAKEVAQNPSRFAAFASVSMHDPQGAADEAERAVKKLGMVGVMLNDFQSAGEDSNTMLFYDDPSYDVFWKKLEELDVPFYMHPRLPTPRIWNEIYAKRRWLEASAWGFANQLSIHILAIITGGVFDRFPKLQMIFGHMGEHIPVDLWRLDHKLDRARFPGMPMAKDKLVRDYFQTNLWITTSGHFSTRSLQNAITELSASRIMFSIDFPYEDGLSEGSTWFDETPIADLDKVSIGRENAIKLLKLDKRKPGLIPAKTPRELGIGGLRGNIYPDEASHLRGLKKD